MARKKRKFLEDDDSDSSRASDDGDPDFGDGDPDAREERALFEDPYQRMKRGGRSKDDTVYGVFGEEDEGEGAGRGRDKPQRRRDWAKAPAFVSGESVDLGEAMDMEQEQSSEDEVAEEEDVQEENGSVSGESDHSRAPSPRVREEEEDELPSMGFKSGGIGSSSMSAAKSFTRAGIGSSGPVNTTPESENMPRFGLGGMRTTTTAGIGSAARTPSNTATTASFASPSPVAPTPFPTAFGAMRAQRAFVRNDGSSSPSGRPATPLSSADRAHFSKISGSFGARMLAKMGWEAGTGLGATGEGIVTPVESKMRPQKMGIAFKGFKEKTEQSKAEARRRGEVVSDDEEDQPRKGTAGRKEEAGKARRSDAWKKPKKVKVKIEHKTYEQILAEAGEDVQMPNIGQIIDATGATPREVSSLAEISISSWTASTDPTRLPEVRHNVRLISDACKSDLDGLAREAKSLKERKQWLVNEDRRLSKKVEEEAEMIARLQQIQLVTDAIANQSSELSSSYEASLDPFTRLVHTLLDEYPKEFERYRLDEIIVAAIAPVFRRMVAQWQPLDDPVGSISLFRSWRKAVKITTYDRTPRYQVDVYGTRTAISPPADSERPMTPFDSLLWNVWLPRVRSCINNDWSPHESRPAIKLYETWSGFLPDFIRDNILDQLIIPKVQKAVADWNPRTATDSLRAIVFPWLPHVGLRLEEFMDDSRRKMKSVLRAWLVSEPIPTDLKAWKEIFDPGDWDALMLKYVVPKLGATLRDDFRINPRKQDMEPLQRVLPWATLIRPSIFSQILQTEFFPKWLNVLHIWLIQPTVNFEEVAQWYQFWKGTFPDDVQKMEGVASGFVRGLQLMNKAIELGPDAPTRLDPPDLGFAVPTPAVAGTAKARPAARTQEITFRSIVEDFAASHNLLFIPTGRAHETSRMPLFRVSPSVVGKSGLLVYILDDAVWAADGSEYRAITLEDMVLKANA